MEAVKILIVGDFCASNPSSLNIGSSLFDLMSNADLKCVNFEGPIKSNQYKSVNNNYLPQSNASPQWLIDNGFNLILLANNHSRDYGDAGLVATIDAFKDVYNLGGCYGWKDAYKVNYIEIKGIKIGLFNATSADFSALIDEWTDYNKYGSAWINHPSIPLIISDAKKNCDYLIVLPHAGVEYMDVPLPEWRTIYRNLIQAGADAVIATHPHVPQGMEIYQGKPIYYSLGNFVFDTIPPSQQLNWYKGLAVQLNIDKEGICASHYPISYSQNIVDIDFSSEMAQYIASLSSILNDPNEYMKKVDYEVSFFANKYEQWMLDSWGAIKYHPLSWKLMPRLLYRILKDRRNNNVFIHQLREESTRWCIIRSNIRKQTKA